MSNQKASSAKNLAAHCDHEMTWVEIGTVLCSYNASDKEVHYGNIPCCGAFKVTLW